MRFLFGVNIIPKRKTSNSSPAPASIEAITIRLGIAAKVIVIIVRNKVSKRFMVI